MSMSCRKNSLPDGWATFPGQQRQALGTQYVLSSEILCKMVTCPTTSYFCPCGLDICPPYLGFPLRRTDLPQILYHDMDRPSLPWKIIFWLSTCVVLSVSLQEFSVVQERFIPPLLPNLVLPELAERWRFSPPSRDLSAN